MSGALIFPPDYPTVEGPMIFLAGPIQGAPDWQDVAVIQIRHLAAQVHLANPRRNDLSDAFDFDGQVDWETHHLRRSAQHGAILFWLARETDHHCTRAYGQTSRFELAEWKMRHERDGVRLVVGIEQGFSGGKYIRRRLAQDCPDVPILATLADTCKAAVERALR
jgi:hypothetical protein